MIGPKLKRKIKYISGNDREAVMILVRKMRQWGEETEIKIFEDWNVIKNPIVQKREKTSCKKNVRGIIKIINKPPIFRVKK